MEMAQNHQVIMH